MSCRRCGSATSGRGTPGRPSPSCAPAPTAGRSWPSHPELGDYALEIGPGPDGTQPTLLFCENETNLAQDRRRAVDSRRIRRTGSTTTSSSGAADGQPGRRRHEGLAVVPAGRAARRDGRAPAAPAQAAGPRSLAPRRRSRRRRPRRQGGNGKAAAEDVAIDPLGPSFESTMQRRESEADEFYEALRREGGTDDEQRILRQAFAGMLWSKQYYGYNVARWLDGDPGLPPPPPERKHGPERGLAALRGGRHPVDARPLGVPLVRGLGPRVPRGHARPHRSGLREVPAAADVPRMVPAPGRGAARLRVVVRRREPAGPRRGRLPRLRRSTDAATSSSCDRIFHKLLHQLHLVAQPRGQGGQRPLLGRLPRPRQHRRLRPVAPAGRRRARAVGRDRLDVPVLPEHAADRDRPVRGGPGLRGLPDDLHGARRADRRGDEPQRAVGPRRTASSTTRSSSPTARPSRSRSTRWSG